MYCKKCGAQVSVENKFCSCCGLQNPAPVNSVTSSNSTLKSVSATSKKKFPVWLIIAAIAVVVIIIIASSSLGSSGLEKDLVSTLPHEIRTYLWDEMAFNFIEYGRDEEYSQIQHVLEVKKLTVDRHSTEGKSDTADCTIVMEDDYIEKTVYVTLYSMEYDTGWVVESWEEFQEPTVVPKAEPDIDYLKNVFDFKNITVTEDNLSLADGKYTYSYTVNDSYTYVDYSGEVGLIASFSEQYNYAEDICVYGWSYDFDDDKTTVELDWKVEGTWTFGISENDLVNRKCILTISSIEGPTYSEYADKREYGHYTGTASYFNANANPIYINPEHTYYYDFSDNSGDYYASSTNGTFNPDSVYTEFEFGAYSDEKVIRFTADSVQAYIHSHECAYINHN